MKTNYKGETFAQWMKRNWPSIEISFTMYFQQHGGKALPKTIDELLEHKIINHELHRKWEAGQDLSL